ncbi:M15 family metallopeptidase [Mangrovimonas sp. YM274]|uniref:M15 family metallopeptidase n=1 Tax=Mangrovimonas sp. YM274 TaxID=3070660 RepID=UPI0027DCE835|nr:M15 family metallopeptidase [Mangrovimonas sp. YM274]WMI70271.1 M15 family metallopeptidase [Mangrovimonas sp. YM274]
MYKKIPIFTLLIFFVSCKNEQPKEIAVINETVPKKEKIVTQNYTYNKDFILGKFNYRNDSTFIKISSNHSSKEIYLNKEVYDAFKEMYNSAKKDGINLIVVSGTRNFYEQKSIWERKWVKYKDIEPLERTAKILEYSSMPSTSRHHWGTDIDLINLNNSYFDKGKGRKEYEWLIKNAKKFGFYQVYTEKENGRTGYNLEKWHWSYLPLASRYLNYYNENITYTDIANFKGYEFAEKVKMISNYVNGISKDAKEF